MVRLDYKHFTISVTRGHNVWLRQTTSKPPLSKKQRRKYRYIVKIGQGYSIAGLSGHEL